MKLTTQCFLIRKRKAGAIIAFSPPFAENATEAKMGSMGLAANSFSMRVTGQTCQNAHGRNGKPAMAEFRSAIYAETLERMRAKRLADPAFWEYNSTLHSDPIFAQACLVYAEKLRKKANG
jgi:hypothetical protein